MTHARIRRTYLAICPACSGRGFVPTKRGYAKCKAPGCINGDVEKVIVEFVSEGDSDGNETK